jgi:hypothetical protein
MAFSDYLENKVLNLLMGSAAYSVPATLYIAALTAVPTDAGGGTEVSGGGYARISVTNDTGTFPTSVAAEKNLGTSKAFPEATTNWGTVQSIGIFNHPTAGDLLMWAAISPGQLINTGDILRIPAGTAGLRVTLD